MIQAPSLQNLIKRPALLLLLASLLACSDSNNNSSSVEPGDPDFPGYSIVSLEPGDDLEDLMTLCEADITSKNERTVKRHLRNFQIVRDKIIEIEAKDSIRNFQPPISGDDIQKIFGI